MTIFPFASGWKVPSPSPGVLPISWKPRSAQSRAFWRALIYSGDGVLSPGALKGYGKPTRTQSIPAERMSWESA